eukprot:84943-Chlamydomonas_euryale.AAC.2
MPTCARRSLSGGSSYDRNRNGAAGDADASVDTTATFGPPSIAASMSWSPRQPCGRSGHTSFSSTSNAEGSCLPPYTAARIVV